MPLCRQLLLLLLLATLALLPAPTWAVDSDADSVADDADNCTAVANPTQLDADPVADLNGDGIVNVAPHLELGSFYYDQLVRFGFEDEAALVKRTFEEHGSAAAAAAIPARLVDELGFAGSAEACRDRILEQERQGIDIHGISLDTREPRAFAKAVDVLLR
jgi:hypothetical protein